MKKYYIVKNKYLAEALCFMGFKYLKFDDEKTGQKLYSFLDTEGFRIILTKLIDMKKKLN